MSEGRRQATEEEIRIANLLYYGATRFSADSDLVIDDDAQVSECDDGHIWVQAWVFVRKEDLEELKDHK